MTYLLDANIISHIARFPDGAAARRASEVGFDGLATSIIAACEISFGLRKNPSLRSRAQALALLSTLEVMPFEPPADDIYGRLRAEPARTGKIIGSNEMLNAAHSRALDCTLVTLNIREFQRMKGLRTENWLRN